MWYSAMYCYHGGDTFWSIDNLIGDWKVTHWINLPEPTKGNYMQKMRIFLDKELSEKKEFKDIKAKLSVDYFFSKAEMKECSANPDDYIEYERILKKVIP